MTPKNKRKPLTALELKSLPISIGEARKLLGAENQSIDDEAIALLIMSLNELAIFTLKNINAR